MESPQAAGITVVIPAFNEAGAIVATLKDLQMALAALGRPSEVLVVDDGSRDETPALAAAAGVRVIRHPTNGGYGRSLITGLEAARFDTIVITDADGTYPVNELPKLLAFYDTGFQMAVGARTGSHYHGSIGKRLLRLVFRVLAEYTCGQKIPDINSGFRVFDRRPVLARKSALSTGFSFTTTITLLFMLTNLFVGYIPISYNRRVGASKVRLLRDSARSAQIIVTAIAQFNPLKLFLLLVLVALAGNALLILWLIFNPANPSFLFPLLVAIGWNALVVVGAMAILSLVLIKPPERDR